MGDVLVRGRTSSRASQRSLAACCIVALVMSALVATGTADRAVATAGGPVTVSNTAELTAAVANGGVINILPGDYDVTSELRIKRSSTELRAVTPGSVTIRYVGTAGRPIMVDAKNVVIDGVIVTGGNNPWDDGGGGIEVEDDASLTLSRSTITGNSDDLGGGILNEGTITVVDSTISNNTASIKGGGLLNEGTATVTNSTFDGNTSFWGSAAASFSTINLNHTTIVRNVTTASSTSYGALQRLSGTFNVRSSIVGDNLRTNGSAARNCAGTVRLLDRNLLTSTAGCTTSGTEIVKPLLVGATANNGGPTPTAALLDGSPAIDVVNVSTGKCVSGVTSDQRGTARPFGAKCDLGAFEKAALELAVPVLSVDTSNYADLPPGTVEVGATSVPTNLIAGEFVSDAATNEDGTLDSARLRSIRLRSIRLRSIELQDIRLRSIDTGSPSSPEAARLRSIEVKANRLRSIALESIRLRSIELDSARLRSIDAASARLRSIRLRSIPLSEIPLTEVPGGWEAQLAPTEFADVPLQSLTLDEVADYVPDNFTLESIDLSSTRLRSIRLRSILLEGTRLRSIPLSNDLVAPSPENDLAWCVALISESECTAELVGAVTDLELWEAQLAGADVDQPTVLDVPLSGLTSARLRSIDPSATDIEDARLRSIRLRSIFLENTALSAIRLRSIRLRSIPADTNGPAITLETIIDCSKNAVACTDTDANTLTLRDVAATCLPEGATPEDNAACLLRDDADFGQLIDLLGVEVAGVSLLEGLTLGDILLAFSAPEDIPWESVDLQASPLQNIATPPQPTFDYVVDVQISQGPAAITVDMRLPQGFALAGGAEPKAATFCPTATGPCDNPIAPSADTTTFVIPGVASGSYKLRVPVRAGSIVGGEAQFQATSTVTATGTSGASTKDSNSVGVNVVQAGTTAPSAPNLRDGQLELGYIGGSGELDVYSFVAPSGSTGASARILLSNVPADVDYDLAVYGPRAVSLRGAPLPDRPAIGDDRFDLDPGDDVLPTDVVDDIALDITEIAPTVGLDLPPESNGYALRDISSRRSNTDEEVTLPALVSGKTYVVVVSGYFGDVSPEPYGLRVRLDRRTAIPACATSTYPGTTTAPAIPAGLEITAGTNTLYVTNAARLDREAGVNGTTNGSAEVLTAIAATDDVNGVDAGLLLLDGLTEWNQYNAGGCDPDIRNVLAKAIGDAIDGANGAGGANGNIENIVFVGGDGVVPMAAVPDLAEYSNESTFALSVLDSSAAGTPIAGALASGFFLSDDPYATDAGISILGGDHELYVPDRNVGRVVETADEIVAQLENFVTYDGKVDPRTFDAAVTGYDFLNDGAQAVIAELGTEFAIDEPLLGDGWDRENYLDLFRDGTDYRVFSPNAHYDFEALLPALPDSLEVYDDSDLVGTSDFVAGSPTGAQVPLRALGFTVGCHAGLNVSDVQVGPTLDWAQLYSQNQTQWVAHTTYGYGDTEIVAYSERLATLFAGNVAAMTGTDPGAPTSLGAAVRDAKQRYLASTLVISPYDEKILQSWTYYGLPMYSIGEPPPPATETTLDAPVDEPIVEETAVEEPLAQPQGFAGAFASSTSGPATFATLGNGALSVSFDLGAKLAEPTFIDPATGASYYSIDGDVISAQDRPVQPLVDVAIPDSGSDQYAGFLITELSSRDLPDDYVPFVSRPTVDNAVDEPRFLAGDVAFPATLQHVTNIGNSQRLLVAAGQWQNGQRLFDRIAGELLPRTPNGDTDAPRFLDVTGTNIADVGASGRGIRFDVETEADATRVVILFREEGTLNWRTLELSGSNGTWFGTAALVGTAAGTRAEFFAQSVDAAGNVGITSNKIENFLSVDDVLDAPDGSITATIQPGGNQAGGRFFGEGGTFIIQPSASTETPATFSINSGGPLVVDDNGITIDVLAAGAESTYVNGVLGLAPGDYIITARFEDGPPTNRFFIVDADAPEVSYSRDLTLWTTPSASGFDVSATDASGVARLTVTVTVGGTEVQRVVRTGTATDPNPGILTASIAAVVVENGASARPTLTVEVEDAVGNIETYESTLLVDNAGPVVSISPKSNDWSNTPVLVTVTGSDPDSGIASVCLQRDAGSCEPITLVNGSYSDTILAEGLTALQVKATDNVGNETTDSTQVRVDTVAPTGTIQPDDDTWRTGTVTAVITAEDPGTASASGIAAVCVQRGNDCDELTADADGLYRTDVTVPAGGDGTPSITVTITDVAGNPTDVGPVTLKIDNKAPELTLESDQIGTWTNTPVAVSASADDGTGSGIAELCLANVCDPTNPKTTTVDPGIGNVIERTFIASATDAVGNLATAEPLTVRVDRAVPTVSVTPDTDAASKGPVVFTIEAGDEGSGLSNVCVIIDDSACTTIVLDDNGEYTTAALDIVDGSGQITVTANVADAAGNTGTATSTVSIDNIAPVVSITPKSNSWSTTPVLITVAASDGESGIETVCLQRNAGNCEPITLVNGSYSDTITTEGLTALQVRVTDNVGNESTDNATVRVDTIAPNVTITPNDALWRAGVVQVTLAVSDPGVGASGIASVCVTTTGGCVALEPGTNGEYATTLTVPSGTDGAPTISATVTDVAGNSTTVGPVALKIDRKAPALTLSTDQVGAWTNTAVTVTATADDGTGSGIGELCLGDTCDTVNPKTATVDPPPGTFIERTFNASATDNVGNTTTAGPVTARVDRAIPTATLSVTPDANADGIYNAGESATATFSCADVGSGVASCALFNGATEVATSSPFTINTSTTGTASLTVQAIDAAGNTFTTPATTLTIGLGTCVLNTSRQLFLLPIYTIRLTLCDAAGNNLSDPNLVLTALAINGTRDPIFNFSGLPLNYRFIYNSAGKFYEYSFFIGGLPRGDNTLSFTTQPVPSRGIGTVALNELATNTATFRLR